MKATIIERAYNPTIGRRPDFASPGNLVALHMLAAKADRHYFDDRSHFAWRRTLAVILAGAALGWVAVIGIVAFIQAATQ